MSFKFTIEDPRLPSLRRWLDLNRRFKGTSTLRKLENEWLSSLKLQGKVLDVGGGKNALYMKMLPPNIDYVSVNIDPAIKPTHLVQPGEKLPIDDGSMDNCIALNTLEHVYDAMFLLREMRRVLRPGGRAYITVPWIFRIHGHPEDYSRYTPTWWQQSLEKCGFESVNILPLVWGRHSSAAAICGLRGVLVGLRNHIIHVRDILYAFLMVRGTDGRYSGRQGQRICSIAMGHSITATA